MTSFQEACEHGNKEHQKHDHNKFAMMPLKPTKYQQFDAASGPPGPIETLSLAILSGMCDIVKDQLKKQKVKCFITKVCLFNYAYKRLVILTIKNQLGAPGTPPDPPSIFTGARKPLRIGSFQETFEKTNKRSPKNITMSTSNCAFKTNWMPPHGS